MQEEEWKNAIEGRMGRLKHSLITEPQYAHEAAVLFRNMKQYENVDLINSKAIADSEPDCLEGSLYDAVKTAGCLCGCMSETVSGTYYEMQVCGGTGAGKGWCDTGLLFVQQFYFPAS